MYIYIQVVCEILTYVIFELHKCCGTGHISPGVSIVHWGIAVQNYGKEFQCGFCMDFLQVSLISLLKKVKLYLCQKYQTSVMVWSLCLIVDPQITTC